MTDLTIGVREPVHELLTEQRPDDVPAEEYAAMLLEDAVLDLAKQENRQRLQAQLQQE